MRKETFLLFLSHVNSKDISILLGETGDRSGELIFSKTRLILLSQQALMVQFLPLLMFKGSKRHSLVPVGYLIMANAQIIK
jgi:hypothetical protein